MVAFCQLFFFPLLTSVARWENSSWVTLKRWVGVPAITANIALTFEYHSYQTSIQGVGTNQPIKRLVFWYGTKEKDSCSALSFIAASKFIRYKEGKQKKYDKLSDGIRKKVDAGKTLTKPERMLVDGLKQMHNDLKFNQDERPQLLMLPDDDNVRAAMLS